MSIILSQNDPMASEVREYPVVEPSENRIDENDYFQYQKPWEGLFVRLCIAARRQMIDHFVSGLHPGEQTRVLDVGITSHAREDSNFFVKWYPYPGRLTCVGLDSSNRIKQLFPHLRYVQIAPGPLPFQDKAFDIGVSSAVIEHVGDRKAQRDHIRELLRVCRNIFVTTPNCYFPIEPHTMLPLLHYLPAPLWRKTLNILRRQFYASEEKLNPLSANQLQNLFPKEANLSIKKVRLLGLPTNLVAVASW